MYVYPEHYSEYEHFPENTYFCVENIIVCKCKCSNCVSEVLDILNNFYIRNRSIYFTLKSMIRSNNNKRIRRYTK